MQYSTIKGYKISRLCLGTVALGMDYGITNIDGKPDWSQSMEVLSVANQLGINTFDTARGYGDAEHVIGGFLNEYENSDRINLATKFRISTENLFNKENARQEVYNSIRESQNFLKTTRIPFCLFHKGADQPIQETLEIVPAIFSDLKNDGLIDVAGISIYHPNEVEAFLEHDILEAMQVPINIFDLRLVNSGLLNRIHSENKIVFARSIFLQGLFFMSPADLSGNLAGAGKYILILQDIAKQAGMDIAQLAFTYIRDLEQITSIIFGATTAEQVRYNVNLLKCNSLDPAIKEAIETAFSDIPEEIITPGVWAR